MTRDGSTSIRTDLQVSGLSQRIRATEAPRSGTEAMMRRRHARYSLTRWRRSSIKESMQARILQVVLQAQQEAHKRGKRAIFLRSC